MNKRIFWFAVLVFFIVLIGLYGYEEGRAFITAFVLRIFLFLKKNLIALLTAFFLVKGKFILTLFLKKLALLSATGLGKRYVVEKVVMGNVQTHFLDHLRDDIRRLINHAKENFQNFPIVKKVITVLAFLGSLGFVAKFMGGMLAIKVFVAKVWSFLLALFLKIGTAVVYFFTEYLWGSWLAPIVEVVIFTWLLSWMEKVPFLAKRLRKIYAFFVFLFGWMEKYIEKIFHIPVKGFLKWLVRKIQNSIYAFIGYKKVSPWKRLQENRTLTPNAHKKLHKKREERRSMMQRRVYLSTYKKLRDKRKKRK